MEDDLFGGLPAVSKTEDSGVGDKTTTSAASAAANTVKKNATSIKPAAFRGGEKAIEKRKAGASLVSSLGTAGTTMAFLPQAIRKKKKPTKPQRTIKRNIVTEKAIPDSGSQTNHFDSNKISMSAPQQISVVTSSETKPDYNTTFETSNNDKEDQSSTDIINPHQLDNNENLNNNNEPYLENEPESLRLLHASAALNPYDPHCPNDYLAHRERKKTEQVRKDLQRSALARLDAQEKLRKKIEEERKKMLASGELDKFVESHAAAAGGGSRNQ